MRIDRLPFPASAGMILRRCAMLAALCVAMLSVTCCDWIKPGEPVAPASPADSKANTNDPHWVRRSTPNRKVAVVFVHGLFGGTRDTWTHSSGKTFFDFLQSAPGVGGEVDIFAFGFTSNMIRPGSLDIGQASVTMHESMKYHGVLGYESIVFVGHSMGGLITMRELISHPELSRKVPLLVFYATPQEGAQIARIANEIVSNPVVRQLFPADGNAYLRQLNEDWVRVRQAVARPTLVCAYETVPMGTAPIVPWATATRNCDTVAPAISSADHITIVKPDRQEHESVIVLVNALRDHVMPRLDASVWETPDFRRESDRWLFPITNINGRNGASIVNRSPIVQTYQVQVEEPEYLMMDPSAETMPRALPARSGEEIKLVLIGDLQEEYRIRLKLGSSPERTVLARIADMEAALTMRAQRETAVAEAVDAYLASGRNLRSFNALSAAAQQEKVADIAMGALAQQTDDLPRATRWIVTADTLARIGWPQSATAALRTAERDTPQIANAPSARHVAGVVAAQSGRQAVFRTVATPPVDSDALPSRPTDLRFAASTERSVWERLAGNMQAVPSLKSDGLVLEGDVRQAQGDSDGARRAYLQARGIRASPLVDSKIQATDQPVAERQSEAQR